MKHLKENNETYFSHFLFAGKVGINLILGGIMFLFHALVPTDMPVKWNLESTLKKVYEWNTYANKRLQK